MDHSQYDADRVLVVIGATIAIIFGMVVIGAAYALVSVAW
jgi:hypothetical protein